MIARAGVEAEAEPAPAVRASTPMTTTSPALGLLTALVNTAHVPGMRSTTNRRLTNTGRPTCGGSARSPFESVQVGSTIA